MYGKKISGIPVASSNNDLSGIITKTDSVRALIETDSNTGPHI
jgi:CBS domain-containing protein